MFHYSLLLTFKPIKSVIQMGGDDSDGKSQLIVKSMFRHLFNISNGNNI